MENTQSHTISPILSLVLSAVAKLENEELDILYFFLKERKERVESILLPAGESDLLEEINKGFAPEKRFRIKELRTKRIEETISENELEELIALSDEFEEYDAVRLEKLIELAAIRKLELSELAEQLGLKIDSYVA